VKERDRLKERKERKMAMSDLEEKKMEMVQYYKKRAPLKNDLSNAASNCREVLRKLREVEKMVKDLDEIREEAIRARRAFKEAHEAAEKQRKEKPEVPAELSGTNFKWMAQHS